MTNKLPVVGKRYRLLHYYPKDTFLLSWEELPEDEAETKPETQSYDSESIKKDQMDKAMQSINDLRVYREGYNKGWNECLEEVKKQMPNHISELSPEVKEAMEELKKADNWFRNNASITLPEHCFKLSNTAFCLLNALDKQFSLNGYFEGLPPSREAIERSKAQPDENGSFKDIDGAEELSQELMKENIEPNKETLKSFSDYEKGVGLTKYDSVEELFDDLEGKNS